MGHEELIDLIGRRYDRFIQHIDHNDPNAAAEEFGRLCTKLRAADMKVPPRVMLGMIEGFIDFYWQCRRYDLMLRAADDAVRLFGDDAEWRFTRGEALFYLGRCDEAWEALEGLAQEDFEDPSLYHMLACLAERRGDAELAERLFQTAHRLDPKGYLIPLEITEEEALRQYEACLKELPETIVWQLRQVPIYVDALPSDDLIKSNPLTVDPLTLGLFMGQPVATADSPWPDDQPRIVLFHKNIAKIAADFDTLEDELRKTVFHEVGHFLGFDEDQLEEMGLA